MSFLWFQEFYFKKLFILINKSDWKENFQLLFCDI